MRKPSDIRILVVDDEVELCQIIGERFSIFGYQVDLAFSGETAWELYQKHDFDIVISDIFMPGMKGDDLARKIRAVDPITPAMFFITGYTDLEKDQIYSMGIDGLFKKPFDASALMTSIRKAVMPLEHRWSVPQPVPPVAKLEWTAKSDLVEPRFGRGGFSFNVEKGLLKEGQRVEFEFAGHSKAPDIHGKGIVRWLQADSEKNVLAGVEVEFVDHEHCQEFVSWLEQQGFVEYIPANPSRVELKKIS